MNATRLGLFLSILAITVLAGIATPAHSASETNAISMAQQTLQAGAEGPNCQVLWTD